MKKIDGEKLWHDVDQWKRTTYGLPFWAHQTLTKILEDAKVKPEVKRDDTPPLPGFEEAVRG
jgi:hypothetical protein